MRSIDPEFIDQFHPLFSGSPADVGVSGASRRSEGTAKNCGCPRGGHPHIPLGGSEGESSGGDVDADASGDRSIGTKQAFCDGDEAGAVDGGGQQGGREPQGASDLGIRGVWELLLDLGDELSPLGAGQGNGEMRAMGFLHGDRGKRVKSW